MLSRFQKKESFANAHVVDGKLILSFPEALTPIVWQIDLGDAKSSSFEVVEENGQFKLVSRMQGAQKKETIAPFVTREKAVEALMATSHALAHAHGHIHGHQPSNSNFANTPQAAPIAYAMPANGQKSSTGKWIFAIISVVLIFGLFAMANSLQPRSPSSMQGVSANAASSGQDAATSSGVPVSADDFLRTR